MIVHGLKGALVFRGFGAANEKSLELLRVSLQPFVFRVMAFVLLPPDAGAEPLKQFAVPP